MAPSQRSVAYTTLIDRSEIGSRHNEGMVAMTGADSHPLPECEIQRLATLDDYRVLETAPDPRLDTIVRHARRVFGVPIALVSLVAENRQYFKARIGINVCELAREGSFCTHTIRGRDVMVVPDATLDARFRNSPLVTGAPKTRFYAGAPLVTPDDFILGALCIIDVLPRPDGLTADECRLLQDLASLVMTELEVRRLSTGEGNARRRFDAVAGSSADAIVCADGENRILSWNKAAERMFGYLAADALGQSLNIIVPPKYRAMHEVGLKRAAAGLSTKLVGTLVTVPALRHDGSEFPIELSLSHWIEGGEDRFGAIARDITERLAMEERLKRSAEYDALTDLGNRTLLDAHLEAAVASGHLASLILLDLDGFKDVNDGLGHASGDQVLKVVAARLRDVTGDSGLPFRLGGDEFVVLLGDIADPLAAARLADLLIKAIERPIELGERAVYVGASAGIALGDEPSWTPAGLLERADLALYQAKADGKSRVRLFTQNLRPVRQARFSVSSDIRHAWDRGEFELYFQPQVRLVDGAIAGAEALIRWNHPVRGVLSPAAFLSTLEGSLLAVPVSEWILRNACEHAARWRGGSQPDFRIGVNLFAAQFRAGDLPSVVGHVLNETGLPPASLELEITENTILRNEHRIKSTLGELREMGVGTAFDDFGTGFASLTMLKDFPVSRLKIDRSFVSGPDSTDRNRTIVEAISHLAHAFKLEVIAEGIESQNQAELMRSYCEEGQGYYFGRPMTASQFEAALTPTSEETIRPRRNLG